MELKTLLDREFVLLDGGMGTMLQRRGLPVGAIPELMNLELLRKDQLYFVDKRDKDGASELYTISEFSTRTTENIRKGYLVGKYGATPDIEIEEVE